MMWRSIVRADAWSSTMTISKVLLRCARLGPTRIARASLRPHPAGPCRVAPGPACKRHTAGCTPGMQARMKHARSPRAAGTQALVQAAWPASASLLRAHVREQQHVADRGAAGQQHDQAVDADAQPAGRRHAVLERTDVVGVVVHRLVVAALLGRDLGLEARGLVLRIVQLGEAI